MKKLVLVVAVAVSHGMGTFSCVSLGDMSTHHGNYTVLATIVCNCIQNLQWQAAHHPIGDCTNRRLRLASLWRRCHTPTAAWRTHKPSLQWCACIAAIRCLSQCIPFLVGAPAVRSATYVYYICVCQVDVAGKGGSQSELTEFHVFITICNGWQKLFLRRAMARRTPCV